MNTFQKKRKEKKRKAKHLLISSFIGLVISPIAFSATYNPIEYKQLINEAKAKGVTSVLITLENVRVTDIKEDLIGVQSSTKDQGDLLLDELGKEAVTAGYWNNGIGQMGVYVTEAGLKKLAASDIAVSFGPDVTRAMRVRANDSNDSLKEIEALFDQNEFVDVEVFLNVDGIDYDINPAGGEDIYRTSHNGKSLNMASNSNMASVAMSAIGTSEYMAGIQNIKPKTNKPSFTAKIDRTAYIGLREDGSVRAIQPVGFTDKRMAHWPNEILELGAKNPEKEIEFLVSLGGGEMYSAKTGYMSSSAINAQSKANERAINSILARAGVDDPSAVIKDRYDDLGTYHIGLTYNALKKMYQIADKRVLSLELNKPKAGVMLNNSTALINMPAAWNAGYKAAGQNIIVMDTGIRKDHTLFSSNGQSKVFFEACFGSTRDGWKSTCPNADSKGDSPLGLVGSGEPLIAANDHGSHVAGIAAGRSGSSAPVPSGVAPSAKLVSVNIFSYNSSPPPGQYSLQAYPVDVLAALNAVKAATVSGTNNPYVVNLSIGGRLYSRDCGGDMSESVISTLVSRGVPVVVATGNSGIRRGVGSRSQIRWPACVKKTIKVSSVDDNGSTLSRFADIGDPAKFTGPIFLAPGRTIVSASTGTTTAIANKGGTSMAAPHVAGLYAAIKAAVPGISVAGATAWIQTTGSVQQNHNVGNPLRVKSFSRIQIPNF